MKNESVKITVFITTDREKDSLIKVHQIYNDTYNIQ